MLQKFRDGFWQAYIVALCVIHAAIAKQADGICVCNKLRNCLLAHTLRNTDNRFDDQLVDRINAKPADKLAINFKVIEREILKVIKGCQACAKIVQCEPAATTVHPISKGTRLGQIGDCRRFGQLEDQSGGINTSLHQFVFD